MSTVPHKCLSGWKDKIHLREVADSIEITTPFLHCHNDYVEIYSRLKG